MKLRLFARVATTLLFLWAASPLGHTQSTPVGTWDMVLSGRQRGLAQITFSNNFTLGGITILTVTPLKSSSSSSGGRGVDERDPTTSTNSTSSVESTNNLYGRTYLNGRWTYDNRGHVIGIMTESGKITIRTNGISIRATVRPGVRMNMVAVRDGSTTHYRGVPLVALPDQSANFFGVGQQAGKAFNELFTLTPAATVLAEPINTFPAGFVNGYDVTGFGPAYNLVGGALFSSQNRMALFTLSDLSTNSLIRAVTGPYRISKGAGVLKGLTDDNHGGDDDVRLKVYKQ